MRVENLNILASVKFVSGESGINPVDIFQNPKKYEYKVDQLLNAIFVIPSSVIGFNDLDQLKAELFEFIELNSYINKESDLNDPKGEININFEYSTFEHFGYTLFTSTEMHLLNGFSISVNLVPTDIE